jgi:hypothetical protein
MTTNQSCLQINQCRIRKPLSEETMSMRDKTLSQASEESDNHLPDRPSGVMRVTKVELVWPGKYNEDGTRKGVPRVSLPFQVIETINASRGSRKAAMSVSAREARDVREGHDA